MTRRPIDEGRRALLGLRRALNDLEQALVRGAEDLRGPQEIEIRIVVAGQRQMLSPLIRDDIYSIGREALANAFRHARASRVTIEFEYAVQHVRLTIRDDGLGFASEVADAGRPGHWGIPGMRERAERLGARLRVWSGPNAGTEVDLTVPAHVAFDRGNPPRRPWRRRGADPVPRTMPAAVTMAARRRTRPSTSRASAPSAMRIPISGVRCATACAMMPKIPTAVSSSASAAKADSNHAPMRSPHRVGRAIVYSLQEAILRGELDASFAIDFFRVRRRRSSRRSVWRAAAT